MSYAGASSVSIASGWSLRHRLQRVLAGLGLLVAALVAVALVLLTQMHDQQQQVIDRYFRAVQISNQLFIAQIDAETAVRGYALTHQGQTLAPARAIEAPSYHQQLIRVRTLLDGNDKLVGLLDRWNAATTNWYRQWAAPDIGKIRAGGRLTPSDVLVGKALFDTNRSAYETYANRLTTSRNSASSALRLRTSILFAGVVIAFVLAVAAGVGLWVALRRWVIAPVAELGAETRLVRSGQLDREVAGSGPTEIVQLAGDVDDMRRDIVTQLDTVERARAEVEAAREALEAQATDLARSNRDLEQFAYVASHDLQEPLRKVASFCQMLERRYAGQLDERADQYIAFAVDGAKRMQQLINDLLTFSRVGRMSDGMVDVDMSETLAAATRNLSEAIESTDAQITHDPLPHVTGERALIVQLLQNLIGNAIKFRGDRLPKVHIGAESRGDFWEFSCRDNGIGIEPQYAERIFVIFQRLHGKDEYGGTGIGLALCKRIVEHHGGQIWLDATAETGTVFRWTLPSGATAIVETGGNG